MNAIGIFHCETFSNPQKNHCTFPHNAVYACAKAALFTNKMLRCIVSSLPPPYLMESRYVIISIAAPMEKFAPSRLNPKQFLSPFPDDLVARSTPMPLCTAYPAENRDHVACWRRWHQARRPHCVHM